MEQHHVYIILFFVIFLTLLLVKTTWTKNYDKLILTDTKVSFDAPYLGNGDVNIIFYYDFYDIYSKKFVTETLNYLDGARIYFKCLPTSRNGKEMCAFSECAFSKSKFRMIITYLFTNRGDWLYLTTPELKMKEEKYMSLFDLYCRDLNMDSIDTYYTEANTYSIHTVPYFLIVVKDKPLKKIKDVAKKIEASKIYKNKDGYYIIFVEGSRPTSMFRYVIKTLG